MNKLHEWQVGRNLIVSNTLDYIIFVFATFAQLVHLHFMHLPRTSTKWDKITRFHVYRRIITFSLGLRGV